MRWAAIGIALGMAGCAHVPVSTPPPTLENAPEGAQQAYFADYPEKLFFAAAAICDGPGQSLVQPSANEVRCESLPDPESAAAIILQFNGTVEALPKFVISFSGQTTSQGYLVTADNYIRVPQRTGGAQQVRYPDLSVAKEMSALLSAAGGRPL